VELWVGVTDNDWYQFLAQRQPDEVNFWQPSGRAFKVIDPGAPFLFKLHRPHDFIVGGGFFVRHVILPLSIAWEAFEEKNGAPDRDSLWDRIHKYRSQELYEADPIIGCIILAEPFFFPPDDWIPVPADWSRNIVQGKTYDTCDPSGATLWQEVQLRLARTYLPLETKTFASLLMEERGGYGAEYLTRARLGQGTFRVLVTEAYSRRCAITQERTLPVLHAGHIKPYGESGPHRVSNGILLRADLHILLDKGYLTLTEDLRVEVSRRIKEDFENGQAYYEMQGRRLAVIPTRQPDRPSVEFIRWHNEHRFLGN
jgi:putative restriction endonuclease